MRVLFLLVCCFLGAVAGMSRAQENNERTLWVYEGGWFQKVQGNRWIEVNADVYDGGRGRYEYREIARTDKYVELYDRNRKLVARHYDDHQKYRSEGDTTWSQGYKGRWSK